MANPFATFEIVTMIANGKKSTRTITGCVAARGMQGIVLQRDRSQFGLLAYEAGDTCIIIS